SAPKTSQTGSLGPFLKPRTDLGPIWTSFGVGLWAHLDRPMEADAETVPDKDCLMGDAARDASDAYACLGAVRGPYVSESISGGWAQPEEDEEVEVHFSESQDIWRGAVGGVPVHERSLLSPECVVGEKKKTGPITLLKGMARIDQRLLRSRLSHLAEGEYDVRSDVIRPRGAAEAPRPGVAMEVEAPGVFRPRDLATVTQAKANARRKEEEVDDLGA
ncbi:unnamed protein product, partial [Durusdinium trenchii]